ncbi:uncharacterized protein LOC113499441 [Trichoplusia ni]|uniref:Uncharacterized protein LOC113499441 n=1 Tax=Trichoplusia ni TaxID=7111 RepID=A0A7E5W4X8_TRINI|nr:uncharacterized protein LOC113499441 [Trichoplusia ni]
MIALNILIIAIFTGTYIIECTPNDEELKHLIKRYNLECMEQTKADPGFVENIKNGDWKIPKEKMQGVKEWSLCMMTKAGLMTKEGVYQIDVALAQVPTEDKRNVEKLIDTCLSKKAIPPPDIALMFIKCYQKAKGNYTVTVL